MEKTSSLPKFFLEMFIGGFLMTAGTMAAYKLYQVTSNPQVRREAKNLASRVLKGTAEKLA